MNIFHRGKGKKSADFRDCMKHTTDSAQSCRVGDVNVCIRAGPAAVAQVLKIHWHSGCSSPNLQALGRESGER